MENLYYTSYKSRLFIMYMALNKKGLCQIHINSPSESYFVDYIQQLYKSPVQKSSTHFLDIKDQLHEYFSGMKTKFRCKLDISPGTEFQQTVWNALRNISFGKTQSYQWVANFIHKPKAVRAVGQANSRNPIPIIIPCHRVISSDGSLGGFSGGIKNKKKLLELEGIYF